MNVTPVTDHPVLELSNSSRILCAGDLHIGIEEELKAKGVHVPSQTFRMERELMALESGFDGLVLLGDVKHQIPGSTRQEYAEIPRFFSAMKRVFKTVHVVRGNHDGQLEDSLPEEVTLHPSSGFFIEDVGLAHGHTWPSPSVMARKKLILAHNHPTILFEEGLGNVVSERCWLRCRLNDKALQRYNELPEEVIVMPSLNRILGGSPINVRGGKLLGPLFTNDMVDMETAEVYLLDGVFLGVLKNLIVQRSK